MRTTLLARGEQTATLESSVSQGRNRQAEMSDTETQLRLRLATLAGRAGSIQVRMLEAVSRLANAETAFTGTTQRVSAHTQTLETLTLSLEQLRRETDDRRKAHQEGMRSVAAVGNRIGSYQSQLESLEQTQRRCRSRLADLGSALAAGRSERDAAKKTEELASKEVAKNRVAAGTARSELEKTERQFEERRDSISNLKQRFSAASERAAVLEELEESQEGITDGVREVLDLAQQADEGPFSKVQGLVADLIQAGVDVAPLVDVVLGETAQHIAVIGDELLDKLRSGEFRPASRVGFVRIDEAQSDAGTKLDLTGRSGIIDRLDRLVSGQGQAAPLIDRLLGNCWLVDSLQVAATIRKAGAPGARFVTPEGEFVDAEGTILVGPRGSAGTLVSRKSELRDLTQRTQELESEIQTSEAAARQTADLLEQQRKSVAELAAAFEESSQELSECRLHTQTTSDRCDELEKQEASLEQDSSVAASMAESCRAQLQSAQQDLAQAEAQVSELDEHLRDAETNIGQLDGRREERVGAGYQGTGRIGKE